MFIKNSLLRVLNASAVQSPIPGSQESLKTLEIKGYRNFAFLTRHSGAAEGLVAPSPFWCRFGKGGKLRLIVERAR